MSRLATAIAAFSASFKADRARTNPEPYSLCNTWSSAVCRAIHAFGDVQADMGDGAYEIVPSYHAAFPTLIRFIGECDGCGREHPPFWPWPNAYDHDELEGDV